MKFLFYYAWIFVWTMLSADVLGQASKTIGNRALNQDFIISNNGTGLIDAQSDLQVNTNNCGDGGNVCSGSFTPVWTIQQALSAIGAAIPCFYHRVANTVSFSCRVGATPNPGTGVSSINITNLPFRSGNWTGASRPRQRCGSRAA